MIQIDFPAHLEGSVDFVIESCKCKTIKSYDILGGHRYLVVGKDLDSLISSIEDLEEDIEIVWRD